LIAAASHLAIPLIMGILPLRTARHAGFLHHKVAGITVPPQVRNRMQHARDSTAEGAANAGEMLAVARRSFAGACLMPPFDHYEVLLDILPASIDNRRAGENLQSASGRTF
jgi:methylenetetrahydrofolate reductase (NADPH)